MMESMLAVQGKLEVFARSDRRKVDSPGLELDVEVAATGAGNRSVRYSVEWNGLYYSLLCELGGILCPQCLKFYPVI